MSPHYHDPDDYWLVCIGTGLADIYRLCTEEEWDGKVRINGDMVLFDSPYGNQTFQVKEAVRLAEELNRNKVK